MSEYISKKGALDPFFELMEQQFNAARTPPRRDPLVLDLDGDGIETVAENGYRGVLFDHNGDGKIDASDAQFSDLRVWRDLNQDGVSQANELFTLNSVGITALDLGYTSPNTNLGNGNSVVRQGSFTRTDGSTGTLGDLSLSESTMEREFITPVAVSLFWPYLRMVISNDRKFA